MGEKAIIADHAKAFIGDMLHEATDKGLGLLGQRLMALGGVIEVVKDHGLAII